MANEFDQFDMTTALANPFDAFDAHQYGSGKSFDLIDGGKLVPTGSQEAQDAQSPTAGNSFVQNALIGSGKFASDMGLGIQQMLGLATRQDATTKRAIDAPIASTAGGQAGQLGTGLLTALPLGAIPGAGTYLGSAAIGAGYGAASPVAPDESRGINTAIGAGMGAAGRMIGGVFGAGEPAAVSGQAAGAGAAQGGSSASVSGGLSASARGGGYTFGFAGPDSSAGLTSAQATAMRLGQRMGMRMTPGQATGSRVLQQLEAKLESQPMTSDAFMSIRNNNQSVLDRVAAAAIGEHEAPDSAVLGNASERLGDVFNSARNADSLIITDPAHTTGVLDGIDSDFEGLIPGSVRDNRLVSRLEGLTQGGAINGEQLGSLSSKLGRAAYKEMSGPSGDREMGQALYHVKDHVDDLLQSSLTGDDAATYADARQQYRTLMQLTGRTGIVNPSTGHVSGASLANRLQQTDRQGYLFGKNQSDLYNAARFSQAFKPIVGDSGTATRLPLPNPIDWALSLPLNIAARAYTSSASVGAARVAAPVARGIGAASSAIAPYAQAGLPGLGGTLAPYLTQ